MKSLARRLQQLPAEAPMFSVGTSKVTAGEFRRQVGMAAASLWARGVGPGHIVAWLGDNSVAMLAQLFACEQLNAVWMPLNWRLALPEQQAQLEHAGAAHLVSDLAHAERAEALRAAVAWTQGPADGVEPGDWMLVYTSGTTGAPKGAMHTVHSMAANADRAIAAQDLGPRTKTLAVLPMFHAGGLCIQTLPTMLAGGQVRVQARFDPDAWFDDVERWHPRTTLLVPALMRALVQHPRWAGADLAWLHFVTAGSQVVPVPLIEAFHARGIPVAQVYGATETGPVSLVIRPDEAIELAGRSGRPAKGVEVRLGTDGELRLRAPNLMRGYHRHAGPSFDAEGFFATGDLAVPHEDGSYEVVGRSKELIISGGENIHPQEIEGLLAGWPGIADAAVVGLPDERWGEVPVLALVMQPGCALDAAARAALAALFDARLARYKHPRRIEALAQLPKTALGKVQRPLLAERLRNG